MNGGLPENKTPLLAKRGGENGFIFGNVVYSFGYRTVAAVLFGAETSMAAKAAMLEI